MSHYSDKENSVRVDFWKPSGKWYTTEAVLWTGNYDGDIFEAFAKSLSDHFKETNRLGDMTATCLEPYHKYTHPIQLNISELKDYIK